MSMEYGIFQSIVEGDQAEAYKKRKAAEQKKNDKEGYHRVLHKQSFDAARQGPDYEKNMTNKINKARSMSKSFKDLDDKEVTDKEGIKLGYALDAKDRHDRRHGNNECAIEFI